ncbi:hypothetical protein OG589_34670 [Sphaerisporangium sp. NBC_01403]|uniref:hypothetical protein n=1 Tax=Sphaerisporangium sp. NBC_01403 TaxID=2903599 RepID=UPI00324BDB61
MPVWLRSKNLWMNSALLLALIAVSAAQFQRTQALSWIAWVLLLICLPLWLLLTAGWGGLRRPGAWLVGSYACFASVYVLHDVSVLERVSFLAGLVCVVVAFIRAGIRAAVRHTLFWVLLAVASLAAFKVFAALLPGVEMVILSLLPIGFLWGASFSARTSVLERQDKARLP